MARIIYGVCGEGLGHASRSRILINHLKKNHEIRVIAGGKAYEFLSKEFGFVDKVGWPQAVYKNNQLAVVHMILRFCYRTLLYSIPSFFKVRKIMKNFKPDVVITDSEPITFLAAALAKIKRISIDNPTALLFHDYTINPREYLSWLFLAAPIKLSTLNADKYIIYDFFEKQIDNDDIYFVKPLIQQGILQQDPETKNHIFVYQTSISHEDFFKKLKHIDETFIVYGFNKEQRDHNLIYKPFNENDFYQDISTAKAIITNGGFTVISEALYLKKPIFSIPIKNHFEQILNGKFIEKLGAGVYQMEFEENDFQLFLKNFDLYKQNLQRYWPGEQKETLAFIENQIEQLLH